MHSRVPETKDARERHPVAIGHLGHAVLRSFYSDPPRLNDSLLGNADLEDSVAAFRFDGIRVRRLRQREATQEAAGNTLDPGYAFKLATFFVIAFTGHGEYAVLHVHINVIRVYAG